ncbi:hypothetical protein I3843_04G124500 [Carya illinoinensis]|nr:hypothetical protein I3760_04G133600 [Carya illinoinensis]KAG7983789.1 hypothetical protein I3843_04G124500 [Carya illinoinensis]
MGWEGASFLGLASARSFSCDGTVQVRANALQPRRRKRCHVGGSFLGPTEFPLLADILESSDDHEGGASVCHFHQEVICLPTPSLLAKYFPFSDVCVCSLFLQVSL